MNRTFWLPLLAASFAVTSCGPDSAPSGNEPVDWLQQAVKDACPPAQTVLGIDIASYQHPNGAAIDWPTVAANRRFVIVKATEGTGYTNSYYADDSQKARAAGMIVGAYHWLNYTSSGEAQADHFLAALGGTVPDGDLPAMLDVEQDESSHTPAQRVAIMKAWLDRVEQVTGRKPMIYSGTWYWSGYLSNPTGYAGVYPMVWAAYVSGCPSVPDDFPGLTMWQYLGGDGVTPGIDAACDQDMFYGSEAELYALAASSGADVAALLRDPAAYAPPRSTDIDGDGKADLCARGWAGLRCFLSKDTTFEESTTLGDISDTNGWTTAALWSTLRMGDINGDKKADACVRSKDGVVCWTSNGTAWDGPIAGPELSDAKGWGKPQYYSTIRIADVNGDGKDDLCARAAAGFMCWPSTGTGFGGAFAESSWSDSEGFDQPSVYGTIRVGDIDGDGDDDVCARTANGVDCLVTDGSAFTGHVAGPAWSDSNGWDAVKYWSTIRLADVNGDGKSDICARSASDLRCHFSSGASFADPVIVAHLSNAAGWDAPQYYFTLRTGDIDANGSDDLCARGASGVVCFAWNGTGFDSVTGPAWSDTQGYAAEAVYQTMRLGDANGDRKLDWCVRASSGWQCSLSSGAGSSGAMTLAEMTDDGGWDTERYYGTIQFGGPTCRRKAEACNGADDDCDGEIDEGVCEDAGASEGGVSEGGAWPQADAGQYDAEPDAAEPAPSPQQATGADTADGCACRAAPRRTDVPWQALAWTLFAVAAARRSRRAAQRSAPGDTSMVARPVPCVSSRSVLEKRAYR